ncbi:MAG: ATPase P, partial [Leptonema sp. (in: Bacteria)]|nr:ATPase P [Leptonema sp. (in: bacteria)]
GDGVNDTIALSEANIGITFAEASRLALYSADILLLKPNLSLLTFLVELSKQTKTKMIQNLSISFGYNILLLPLAFMGFITPLLGAIFMSLSSICVVINSLTLMKSKITGLQLKEDQPT